MKKYITETLQTPVRYECDVLVCGGGTTGFTAALAAARNGAKTILIERFRVIQLADEIHGIVTEFSSNVSGQTVEFFADSGH